MHLEHRTAASLVHISFPITFHYISQVADSRVHIEQCLVGRIKKRIKEQGSIFFFVSYSFSTVLIFKTFVQLPGLWNIIQLQKTVVNTKKVLSM